MDSVPNLVEAQRRIEECREKKTTTLQLNSLGLTRIPMEIADLIWLQGLSISNNQISKIENLENLENLEMLLLNSNEILQIENLENLRNLKLLGLNSNKINKIVGVKNLFNLSYLELNSNFISIIEGLNKKISNLSLNDNLIKKIGGINHLDGLSSLSLNINHIRKIENLESFNNLLHLHLNDNKITKIEGLNNAKKLHTLSLSNNFIRKLENLNNLENLVQLWIENNQIREIDNIESLVNIEVLRIEGNEIIDLTPFKGLIQKKIPVVLDKWNLKYINKHGFFICDNPIQVPDIETIKRGNEAILNYFKEIEESKDFEAKNKKITEKIKKYDTAKIVLIGNSNVGKTNFSSFLRTGKLSKRKSTHGMMLDTWELEEENLRIRIWDFGGQEYYHNTYRLFFQGNCLFALLWDKENNRNKIEKDCIIDETQNPPTKEDVLHFENEYWLDNIMFYSSVGSGIFMIQNKADNLKNKARIDSKLYDNYNLLKEDFSISLIKSNEKEEVEQRKMFVRLKEDILSKINEIAKNNTKNLPIDRVNIRNFLFDFQNGQIEGSNPFISFKDKLYITKEEFKAILHKEQIASDLTQETVIDEFITSLQQQGLVLYYSDNQALKDYIFINPLKLSDEIYQILSQEVRKKEGIYVSKQENEVIIDLMLQMDIIFKMPNKEMEFKVPSKENEYIAPQYLPEHHVLQGLYEIAETDIKNNAYYLKLPLFYYRKVMQQLILHYGKNQDSDCKAYYWKHGILIKKDGIRLLIKGLYPNENQSEGIIAISTDKKSGYLKLEREVFKFIGKVILNIPNKEEEEEEEIKNGKELVVILLLFIAFAFSVAEIEKKFKKLLQRIEVSIDGIYFLTYYDLLQSVEKNELKIIGKNVKGETKQLITNDFQAMLDKVPDRPLKVFISYSHKDGEYLDMLQAHLRNLRRKDVIDTWTDRKVIAGEEWDERIMKELREADVVIMMMSAYFMDSDYIWEKELNVALNDGKKRLLLPIFIRPFDFHDLTWKPSKEQLEKDEEGKYKDNIEEVKLSKIQWLPFNSGGKLQAVSVWQDRDEALTEVAKKIREAIENYKTT